MSTDTEVGRLTGVWAPRDHGLCSPSLCFLICCSPVTVAQKYLSCSLLFSLHPLSFEPIDEEGQAAKESSSCRLSSILCFCL